jgi:hypothetical protein
VNRSSGADISTKQIALMPAENPESPLFIMRSRSNRPILIPPDKPLLLHVTSDGFREWEESIGAGKPIYLPSGTRLTLDVQLEPVDN